MCVCTPLGYARASFREIWSTEPCGEQEEAEAWRWRTSKLIAAHAVLRTVDLSDQDGCLCSPVSRKWRHEVARERELSLAEVVRRGVEYITRAYPPLVSKPEAWAPPAPRHLGPFRAPVAGWRCLANEPDEGVPE